MGARESALQSLQTVVDLRRLMKGKLCSAIEQRRVTEVTTVGAASVTFRAEKQNSHHH
jgi:hypothetical protein